MQEKLIKMGEKDDTLPPEYRPTEEDRKVADVSQYKCRLWFQFSNAHI